MRIVLIGAGNLATNLGKALCEAGHSIEQVYSRTMESADALASRLNCDATNIFEDIVCDADCYVISVKDSVLENVAHAVLRGREDCLFLHTAGSMPLDTLPSNRRGVLYPMQTFSKHKDVNFKTIPCFIEAKDKADLEVIKLLADSISQSVYELESENRKYLHLSAVFCCNFANRCFALGAKLLKEHGDIPFEVMLPLIDETASKLHTMLPSDAQTGPAVRWDENVIGKQMALLEDNPEMKEIYSILSKSIHNDKL